MTEKTTMTIQLNTKNLTIRTTQRDDLDTVAAIWGDREGGKYLPDPYYKSGDELLEILEETPECPVYYFVAILFGSDKVMATCSLGLESSDSATWSIGYAVHKDYWGNGYAIEMVNALIDFARNNGISVITAPVAQKNAASNRVLEKCGFHVDGESSFKKSGTDIVQPSFIYKKYLT
ncbi:MAG: GNAT family N-acetyltransferase [Defluviitaleaceae bacterium]|nr:GNAT family N-acetyltransferase [Defluviitaleaceae bacterium]